MNHGCLSPGKLPASRPSSRKLWKPRHFRRVTAWRIARGLGNCYNGCQKVNTGPDGKPPGGPLLTLLRLARGLLPDDLGLQGAQGRDQLFLLLGPDLVLLEGLAEVLDGGVPLRLGDLHALVGRLHVTA